ncbi:hypothetical protein MKW94_018215 [Papaver nudicaule]|uniref:Protein FAR1-RELATED SEQUENCE n=1 Tax=Papaver nudicaule TaxID=74823 RepID=A0AA41VKC1_PAPNU|nr:hypothetical protein [Papaver nudicaule]
MDGVNWIVRMKIEHHNLLLVAGRTRMQRFLELKDLYSPSYLPYLFIRDDDQQLQMGVAEVFPGAKNLMFAFHIKRNVCAHFNKCMNKDTPEDLEKIKRAWDVLWMYESEAMYKINLNYVEILWGRRTRSGFLMLRRNGWLVKKNLFMRTNEIKHFGNKPRRRRACYSYMIPQIYEECLVNQGIKIRASFARSKNICLHEHRRSPYIKHLVYHVSRTDLDLISFEFGQKDPRHCQHNIRKTHGLPCACEIFKRYRMGQTLQLD